MQLSELSESINVSHFAPAIKQAIIDGIFYSIVNVENSIKSYTADDIEDLSIDANIRTVGITVRRKLKSHLDNGITELGLAPACKIILRDNYNYNGAFRIIFANIGAGGTASRGNASAGKHTEIITLNRGLYLEPIVDKISDMFYQHAVDNLESDNIDGYIKAYKSAFKSAVKYKADTIANIKYEIDKPSFNNLVKTIIHELVHIAQSVIQHKIGRDNIEYRSYIEKDKNKFYNSINTINTGTHTPDTIKLHHSSPQEVGAIVNELVIDAISETGLDDNFSEYSNPLEVLNTYVKEINPNLIDNIIKQRLSYFDKKDPIENKIRQRYIKLTYQGIQHYISNLYKQVKNMEANK